MGKFKAKKERFSQWLADGGELTLMYIGAAAIVAVGVPAMIFGVLANSEEFHRAQADFVKNYQQLKENLELKIKQDAKLSAFNVKSANVNYDEKAEECLMSFFGSYVKDENSNYEASGMATYKIDQALAQKILAKMKELNLSGDVDSLQTDVETYSDRELNDNSKRLTELFDLFMSATSSYKSFYEANNQSTDVVNITMAKYDEENGENYFYIDTLKQDDAGELVLTRNKLSLAGKKMPADEVFANYLAGTKFKIAKVYQQKLAESNNTNINSYEFQV